MRTLNDYFVYGYITGLGSATTTYIPCPDGGRLKKLFVTANTATDAAIVFTLKSVTAANVATAITSGTATTSGAIAIGATESFNFSPQSDGTDYIAEGGSLEIESDAGGTVGAVTYCAVLRR